MAENTTNRIISIFDFKANLNILNKIKSDMNAVTGVAKKNAASVGMVNKALSQIGANKQANANLRISDGLMEKTGLSADKLSMAMKRMGLSIKGGKVLDSFNREAKVTDKVLKDLKKSAVRFNMALLSVMFAGMALQRVSSRAFRSLVTTYQKANEETQGLGKSTWQLQAAWEFFKYSIIDALTQSSLFKMVVEWVISLIQWFNKLPASVKVFIAIGIVILWVVGTVLLLIGQIGLFLIGLQSLGIGTTFITAIGAAFWWVALIIATVIALWVSDFGGFRDFVKETLGIVWLWFKLIFGHIWNIVKNTLAFIVAIFKGDFDKAGEIMKTMWKESAAFTIKTLIALAAVLRNIFMFMINMIVDALQLALNLVVFAINELISQINRIPGISIPLIPKVDLSGLHAAYVTLKDVQSAFDVVDKKLGLTESLNQDIPTLTDSAKSNTTKVDNSSNTYNLDFNISGENIDEDALATKIMANMTDELNRKNDSTI